MSDGFIFYESFLRGIEFLPEKEQAKAVFAIVNYGIRGIEPTGKGVWRTAFEMAKPQIDANEKRRENGAKGSKYGTLGGRRRKENEETETPMGLSEKTPMGLQTETPMGLESETPMGINSETPKYKVKDKVKVKDKEKEKENNNTPSYPPVGGEGEEIKKRFVPPTVEEVAAYCTERGNGIDAEEFISHYGAKNWMMGKTKMSNWKLAVVTWEKKRGFKYIKPERKEKPPEEDRNEGLEKRNMDDPMDNERHPFEDGWRINDDGYWIRI